MGSLGIECLKLRRSLSWAVVIVLPLAMVVSGSVSTSATGSGLEDGWHTLWIRSIGFYGMAILPVGVAILASLVWRVEHRGGNWNTLMSAPVPTHRIVIGKTAAISLLAAVMQGVFLIGVIAVGKLMGLPGILPATYMVSSALVVIAGVPVAALQSTLSMLMRSFAVPVAISLVLTGASTMALMMHLAPLTWTPYTALTEATQVGTVLVGDATSAFDAAPLTGGTVVRVVAVATVSTVVILAGTTALLDRRDTRA